MNSVVGNFFHYIKCLITGEEYISPETKFTYALHLFSAIHLFLSVLFSCFGTVPLVIYNIFSVLFYQWMVSFCKKKYYMIAFAATICEVFLFVTISTMSLGNALGFSFYCFATIPAIFYCTYTIKKLKSSIFFPTMLSTFAMIVFLFCYTYPYLIADGEYVIPGKWRIMLCALNVLTSFIIIILFCLLLVWEIKNSNAILEKRNNQLTQFANRDPLTKLPNRRSMMEHLNLAMHKFQLGDSPFTIILGDIDDFKKVNDTYGHDAGDKVLVTVANLITSQMREGDYVCRWGGEEILIVIRDDLDCATRIAERIRTSIDNVIVPHGADELHITMTFGVAPAIAGYRIEQIIHQADTKLYQGKGQGKNQVVS